MRVHARALVLHDSGFRAFTTRSSISPLAAIKKFDEKVFGNITFRGDCGDSHLKWMGFLDAFVSKNAALMEYDPSVGRHRFPPSVPCFVIDCQNIFFDQEWRYCFTDARKALVRRFIAKAKQHFSVVIHGLCSNAVERFKQPPQSEQGRQWTEEVMREAGFVVYDTAPLFANLLPCSASGGSQV